MRAGPAIALLLLLGVAAGARAAGVPLTVLARPSFPPRVGAVVETGPTRLALASSVPRDPATSPAIGISPSWAPRTYHGAGLLRAFRQSSTVFLLYGADGTRARYLVASNASSHRQRYAFDFGRFMRPPLTVRADAELVTEQLVWAREADGVLYTESAHQTYAASSHGRNAYVTAVSIPSGRILWRSRALVANASTFVLAGAAIVTGYGFTSEPDYLYLLDRSTGRVRDRLPVPSAPERIVRHGRRLAVRTYDRGLVVDLRPP